MFPPLDFGTGNIFDQPSSATSRSGDAFSGGPISGGIGIFNPPVLASSGVTPWLLAAVVLGLVLLWRRR